MSQLCLVQELEKEGNCGLQCARAGRGFKEGKHKEVKRYTVMECETYEDCTGISGQHEGAT